MKSALVCTLFILGIVSFGSCQIEEFDVVKYFVDKCTAKGVPNAENIVKQLPKAFEKCTAPIFPSSAELQQIDEMINENRNLSHVKQTCQAFLTTIDKCFGNLEKALKPCLAEEEAYIGQYISAALNAAKDNFCVMDQNRLMFLYESKSDECNSRFKISAGKLKCSLTKVSLFNDNKNRLISKEVFCGDVQAYGNCVMDLFTQYCEINSYFKDNYPLWFESFYTPCKS